jgi:hypothetical protein
MPRPEPDVEAFRSALTRELASVSPRPGGWERVRASLARPVARSRPRWLTWLLLAAPLLAAGMLTGALARHGDFAPTPPPGQAVEAPPAIAVYGALVAVVAPVSLAEVRRLLVRQR